MKCYYAQTIREGPNSMRQGVGKIICNAEIMGVGRRETNKREDKYETCPDSKVT